MMDAQIPQITSQTASKKNIVNGNFNQINTFYLEGTTVVINMCDLMVGIFEHLDITSKTDLDIIIKYT